MTDSDLISCYVRETSVLRVLSNMVKVADNDLVYESLWTLCNLTYGDSDACTQILSFQYGFLPLFN